MHYIYETESLQKFETKSIALFQLLRKILYENLISYEEALQIQNFQLFNIIENIDLECQLQQYMQKLLDSPIIIRNNLELSSFSNSSSKSVLAYGKEENCKIENLQKQSQIKENNISVDISENLSQFSFSDYSLQKS